NGEHALVIPSRARKDDVVIFIGATLTATLVAIFVLQRADGSADEWAYTWQAASFAKLHVYGTPPPCDAAFQNFYVFSHVGRWFGQYTPGWPLFMMPFTALGVPWIAGPFSHGLFAVGVARVARSAVRLDGRGTEARVVSAGRIAAICATLATTTLLVGASRYSHVFAAALFAWALESILVLRERDLTHENQIRWGVVFGSAVALMGATRPADGATLATGLLVLSFFNLVTRRLPWRAVAATFGALVLWGGLVLLILHAQLGEWFTTGYSLNKIIHPWNVVKYAWPRPGEWKFALPLATGSYAWFPLSFAVGLAGLATLRRSARGVTVALVVSAVVFDTYYQYLDLGRPYDWGYGPRYETPLTVVMAIGTGVALAPLAERWRRAQGPLAIAALAIAVTLVRLWPLLYPGVYAHVHQHDSLNRRAREMGIHNAVVIAQPGATGFDALDLTENLPMDLYPNQDVLIAIERKPQDAQCVRKNYAERKIYRATGNPVVITPY
ncbi:MAG TPA: hypothetical protein VH054_24725, partial [Polyangiaceae bacterium]|nr:hypothetical protein [Polyangiaceae bacterium]